MIEADKQTDKEGLLAPAAHWPEGMPLSDEAVQQARQHAAVAIQRFIATEQLPQTYATVFSRLLIPMGAWLLREQRRVGRPLQVAIGGSQGSGKSTFTHGLRLVLHHCFAVSSCVLSLDDFYLPRDQRQALARAIHPLLITRGVPGTHDLELLARTISRLKTADPQDATRIPMFDKNNDDRAAVEAHHIVHGRPGIIFVEGWCLGARPQTEKELEQPINELEASEDVQGHWRQYVNRQLAGPYQELCEDFDHFCFLKAPSWDAVKRWRLTQEAKLIRNLGDDYRGHLDHGEAFEHFMAHYERITRQLLAAPAENADMLLELDELQRFERLRLHFSHS